VSGVRQLVRIKHGSHLYGTNTSTSDQDFKGVHLPSGDAIILQRAQDVINEGVTSKASGTLKNDANAIDSDSYSLQKFLEMLMKGDTVATEILFAPNVAHVGIVDSRWLRVQSVGMDLINRECKGFVGYCVRQAAKYGIKGSRMAAVRAVLDIIGPASLNVHKLGDIEPELRAFAESQEHASFVNIQSQHGVDCWHIDVCDRRMPMNVSINEAYAVYNKVWENYGERARAAMTNEGIDWKAMSHAVRVARQAIELLATGVITFPRPDAAELVEIKAGRVPYSEVSVLLERLVAEVHVASERSPLPAKSDASIADALILEMYRSQL